MTEDAQPKSAAETVAKPGPGTDGETAAQLPAPPPLPRRLVDIRPLLALGTAAWFVAFVVLLLGDRGEWMWTSLAGWLLGLAGFGVVWWQRTASSRGRRGAQRGL